MKYFYYFKLQCKTTCKLHNKLFCTETKKKKDKKVPQFRGTDAAATSLESLTVP